MKKRNSWALMPVKRSHLVSTTGVGSLTRLRNGATGLIAGLRSWEQTIPVPVGDQHSENLARQAFLKQYEIRDPELESACGVTKFYQPPRASEDEHSIEWQIPVIVFPKSAICENFNCGSIAETIADSGKEAECQTCDPVSAGRRKKRYRQKQSPIFLVCPDGHIDEVKWDAGFEHAETCSGGPLKAYLSGSIRRPRVECSSCKKTAPLPKSIPCTGSRTWIPGAPNEPCLQAMFVVDRTSVQTYFPQNKTSIHVPAKSGMDNAVLDWILTNIDVGFVDATNATHLATVESRLTGAGFSVNPDLVRLHLDHIAVITSDDFVAPVWDYLEARAHELNVLTKADPKFITPHSQFLEFHDSDIRGLNSDLFGVSGLFSHVVAVTRLTETRVQDGFSRWQPAQTSPDDGYKRIWGHHPGLGSWLPAYRAHGEGILFVLNPNRISTWLEKCGFPTPIADASEPNALSYPGVLAHSLAHLIMTRLSYECGYSLPSICDRIYDLPDGRQAFLVYTAESDIMGTLGGLVDFGDGPKLEELVKGALQDAIWCSQDPVCIGRIVDAAFKQAACCHKCLYLPETSCEWMNTHLDRATIVGSKDRNVKGIQTK